MHVNIPGYDIVRPIAEGGMASVYLAVQESLGRHVALKLLRKFDTPGQAHRFQNEGHIIASLNHRNIITLYDVGACGDQHYISMEYLEGGDLEARIQAGMSPEATLDLLQVMGGCLDFLHRQEIIHRDIKPANILFHRDGTPILTDFGVARQLESDMRLTMEGSAVGSPYYLSPEQAECRPLDGRTDIYGLGIIFHEMLTGEKPYQGASQIETILAHLTEPLPKLPQAFTRYQELLEQMIAKDPDDRFRTAGDMLASIHRLRECGVSAPAASGGFVRLRTPARFREPPRKRSQRHVLPKTAKNAFDNIIAGVPRALRQRRVVAGAVLLIVVAAGLLITLPSLLARQTENGTVSHAMPAPAGREVVFVTTKTETAPLIVTTTTDDAVLPGYKADSTVASVQPGDGYHTAGDPEITVASATTKTPAREAGDALTPGDQALLRQARKALGEYRLTTPARDNAYYYYRRVLQANPDHAEAQAGVARIAGIYANLAERELDRFHYPKAKTYIDRGLAVDPNNNRLHKLESDLSLGNAARRAIGKVKTLFQ